MCLGASHSAVALDDDERAQIFVMVAGKVQVARLCVPDSGLI